MSFRLQRIASLVQQVVGEAILTRVSDPRVSRFTSVTRVKVSPDLSFADVYVSVIGGDSAQRTTLRGLASARGLIQTLLARSLTTRQCPAIRFHADSSIKRGIDTLREIDRLSGSSDGRSAPGNGAAAEESEGDGA